MCTCHAYTLCVRRIASVSRAINVTVFYAFVVFRVFVVKEKLHRVPLQDVGYVRATQRCGSVTSKSLGVGEFTRYRPLLVLPFATRPLRIASSFSLSLSFRYLYFLPLTFFHLIYICTYIYLYVHIYISREIRECRRGLLIPREKGDGESCLSVSYLCVYACVCVRMCDRAGNRIKKGRSFRERDRIRACDS